MKIQPLLLGLWILPELFFGLCYTASFNDFAFPDDSSVVFTYNRSPEIEHQCRTFLSSPLELKLYDDLGFQLKNELSFFNGDWEQEIGGAPIVPFDDSDMPMDSSSLTSPWRLVSFEVKDVNPVHLSQNTVSLRGVLTIGISRNSTFLSDSASNFHMRPGMSALRVDFEGVYIEREENGGERLACLLGNSTLPIRRDDDHVSNMENNFDMTYKREPQLMQNDQILLVLRYPKVFNLTQRAIRGEMRSLTERGNFEYFDNIYISAQLGGHTNYQFSSEQLMSKTCDTTPLEDEMVEDSVNMFESSEICHVLKRFTKEFYSIAPNLKLSGSGRDDHSNRLGPFLLGRDIKAVDRSYKNFRLVMQNVRCEQENLENKSSDARVSAVLRLYPATMDGYVAAVRSGLSGMTLSVEGTWNSSKGQLCMVGCLGVLGSGYDSRITMYFPRSLSNKQRSIISGSITSIKTGIDSDPPILFGAVMRFPNLWFDHSWYCKSFLSYNYSMTALASAFKERSQPSKLITTVRQLLLTYPAMEDREELIGRLDFLAHDLYIGAFIGPNLLGYGHMPETFVQINVLSLGPLLGRYDHLVYRDGSLVGAPADISKSAALNVSLDLVFIEAPIKLREKSYNHVEKLYLEGLYDPLAGEMYLIGCRKVVVESVNVERGLDCLIDVKIEYSSETTRWLINPTATITITSQRNESDLLYFSPISLQTFMIHDRKHAEHVLFRKIFEGALRILLQSVSVALILSQFSYMKKNSEVIPYVSLVMLALQIFLYSYTLINNSEILFKSSESNSYKKRAYSFVEYQTFLKVLDYTGKLLVLAALILTTRLFKLVLKSRRLLIARGVSKSRRVPNDVRVLLVTLAVQSCWLMFTRLIQFGEMLNLGKDPITLHGYVQQIWTLKLAIYFRMVQDFVPLPQIIANRLWKTRVINPVRKAYIHGFLMITLLLIFYDNVRDRVDYPV
ncbi:hypothetical protein RJ640_029663 [Escallonia rubra]|uniref:RING-type E3 ubiquitin transferase n=1 Tax=Escallonia rubra TaxID=112253 RepID=A0AA88QG67_9ASTE|nr:hypothetical protein RJ640_029663 [Escallonia rubra]